MIKMFFNQNKTGEEHETDEERDAAEGDAYEKKVFVYADEVLDKKIHPSSEEEELINMKTKLLRHNYKDFVPFLDGKKVFRILEFT